MKVLWSFVTSLIQPENLFPFSQKDGMRRFTPEKEKYVWPKVDYLAVMYDVVDTKFKCVLSFHFCFIRLRLCNTGKLYCCLYFCGRSL